MLGKRKSILAGAAALAVIVPITMASADVNPPRQSAGSDYTDEDQRLILNQEVLLEYSDWIESQPDIHTAGYVTRVNNPREMSVELLWLEGKSEAAVPIVEEGERRGLTVEVIERTTSMDDILALHEAVFDATPELERSGLTVVKMSGLSADIDGVQIDVAIRDDAPLQSDFDEQSIENLVLSTVAKNQPQIDSCAYTVSVVEQGPELLTRGTDPAPTFAGAQIGPLCTTGFVINYQGQNRATTARHCNGDPL